MNYAEAMVRMKEGYQFQRKGWDNYLSIVDEKVTLTTPDGDFMYRFPVVDLTADDWVVFKTPENIPPPKKPKPSKFRLWLKRHEDDIALDINDFGDLREEFTRKFKRAPK